MATLPPTSTLVVNADDPLVADLADGRAGALRFGVDDPRLARPALQHAADSKYCVRCGEPYDYAAAYVGHLGDYRCPNCGHSRPPLDIAARSIDLQALDASVFDLVTPAGTVRVTLPLPGLYNVYNALAAAATALALDASLDEIAAGLGTFTAAFGRFERIEAGDKQILMLLIKNPAGANEAIRTLEEGGVPETLVIALNDRIADGRDVSWIWDVDFEPLLERVERIVASGERAAELALRFTYAGFPPDRLEVIPDLRAALDRGLALVPPGGELGDAPHLHGDARAAEDRRLPRARAPVLGGGVVRIAVAHLYPDYLNIYADRGNIAVLGRRAALRGHSLEVTGVEPGDALEPWAYDLVYVGGGQDREQALIAPDLAARGDDLRRAVDTGTAVLAVCGGYQLLGRGYRGRDGSWMPGAGVFPHETLAGEKRLIGDVLLEADLGDGITTTVAGFENHAGRTLLDTGATPLGRVVAGHGNDGESGFEGCRVGGGDRHLPPRAAAATQSRARRLAARRARSSTAAAAGSSSRSATSWSTLPTQCRAGGRRSRGGKLTAGRASASTSRARSVAS